MVLDGIGIRDSNPGMFGCQVDGIQLCRNRSNFASLTGFSISWGGCEGIHFQSSFLLGRQKDPHYVYIEINKKIVIQLYMSKIAIYFTLFTNMSMHFLSIITMYLHF